MIAQFLFIIGAICSIPLLPFLIYQGKKVRREVPSLPEAAGPDNGVVGEYDNSINLLMLGESTIAGVGVKSHQEGIVGALANALSQAQKCRVNWKVTAKSGYRVKEVAEKLVPMISNNPFDFIVIGLGGNDTFQLNNPWRWRKEFIVMLKQIRQKQPHSKIIIANMPPIGQFPAFHWTIQLVLGNLVKLHGMALRDVPTQFQNVFYIDKAIHFEEWGNKVSEDLTVNDFFSDGVHPSQLAYKLWGNEMAEFIIRYCR